MFPWEPGTPEKKSCESVFDRKVLLIKSVSWLVSHWVLTNHVVLLKCNNPIAASQRAVNQVHLKRKSDEISDLRVFHRSNLSEPLTRKLKIFPIWVKIWPSYSNLQ